MHGTPRFTAEMLLQAYAEGVFPMALRRDDDELYFVSPEERGVIPLDGFHVSHRLARTVRSDRFEVRVDSAFDEVIRACAAAAPGRAESWINAEIVTLYNALHRHGNQSGSSTARAARRWTPISKPGIRQCRGKR